MLHSQNRDVCGYRIWRCNGTAGTRGNVNNFFQEYCHGDGGEHENDVLYAQ
jgi:hypothetical protein